MKFIHTSDLHIGKRLNDFSLIEDQEYILNQLIEICKTEKPELFIIAGDVYDKSVPSAEAVTVFDSFVSKLKELDVKVAIISGNHDSAERLSFGNKLMRESGFYISPCYEGKIDRFVVDDVTVWLLPFIRPSAVRHYTENEITSYTQAVIEAIKLENIDYSKRNIILSHQFVTGASLSESEDIVVGGLDNVDVTAYEGFDYVALGHIHKLQQIANQNIYYSGTPLKYSFSEVNHTKSVIVGELKEKGNLTLETIDLSPLRDMKKIKGKFEDLIESEVCLDYVHAILTDEEEITSVSAKLSKKFPNLMSLEYQNERTKAIGVRDYNIENKDPFELFSEFYKAQNGMELSPIQEEYIRKITSEV